MNYGDNPINFFHCAKKKKRRVLFTGLAAVFSIRNAKCAAKMFVIELRFAILFGFGGCIGLTVTA